MTFYPKVGTSSTNDFSSASGATINNTTTQGITGGYLTLLPQNVNTYKYISTWPNYSSWTVNNRLISQTTITGTFTVTGFYQYQQAAASNTTGYQGSFISAGAWEIYTPYPTISGRVHSGAFAEYIGLNDSSPYGGWSTYFEAAGTKATIEFDVSSTFNPYSGINSLQGFQTGQENITGLSYSSPVAGHGLYINTSTYWDYLEVLPYGIRSIRHPELAISTNLSSPKRFRVAVNNQDIYILCEDGRSVAGLGKFNSVPINALSEFAIGAPQISGAYSNFTGVGVSGFAGHTFWSNLKIEFDEVRLQDNPTSKQYYSTSPATTYTDTFDPSISISKFVAATVGFAPYYGGTTVITAQYSGLGGYIDSVTTTITGGSRSPINLDLSTIPTWSYARVDAQNTPVSNPIRFKIVQTSTLGINPPPAVDYIKVTAASDRSYLDLLPNWKPVNRAVTVTASVLTGNFVKDDPYNTLWTNYLINVPSTTGAATGRSLLVDYSRSGYVVNINGTGEIQYGGPYGYCYQNYIPITSAAATGSTAATHLGVRQVSNFFPNSLFDEPFRPVLGETNYITGKVFGTIAQHMYIPSIYTGRSLITYSPLEVVRPDRQAREDRIGLLLGHSSSEHDYVQKVTIPAIPSTDIHDGSVGIEARIPSGIATSNMVVDVDLQIPIGSGINIYTSGAASYNTWFLDGDQFRTYRQISFPITASTNGEVRIGFNVPSGISLNLSTEYNIDNLTVTPIATSYINSTGLYFNLHNTGLLLNPSSDTTYFNNSASTVFNSSIYLDSYPATSGTLIRVTGAGGGFSMSINASGYIDTWLDTQANAWGSTDFVEPFTENLPRMSVTSIGRVPLGRWTSVGFIHQASTYDKLNRPGFTGAANPVNVAATNRVYITIDGQPTASVDTMSGWTNKHVINTTTKDSAPYISYINTTGALSLVLFSGLLGRFDAVSILRPPVADAEVDLSINGSRVTSPYLVPEYFHNGTVATGTNNVLITSGATSTYGLDIYIGSCYNFSNPGYTNWDHGPWRNHLLFYGTVAKETGSPYNDLGSTRFYSGAYGVATYSSAADRFINATGTTAMRSVIPTSGHIKVQGWFYPRTTGELFAIVEDKNFFTGSRISYFIDHNNNTRLTRVTSTGHIPWSATGSTVTLNQWNYGGFEYLLGNTPTVNTSSEVRYSIFNQSGAVYSGTFAGVNFGFRYKGKTGETVSSIFKFAGDTDVNLCDWAITCPQSFEASSSYGYRYYTGHKGGRYQTLLEGATPFSGAVRWTNFHQCEIDMPAASGVSDKLIWIAAHNAYDNTPRLNGGALLYDYRLFKEVQAYHLSYDFTKLYQAYGATDSPIRIGNRLPNNAINIARLEGPEFTVLDSVNIIDLSHKNIANLNSYKGGEYTIARNEGFVIPSTITGNVNGINSSQLSGRADIIYSGELFSENIEVSTISIANKDLDVSSQAYYYYLLGRGKYGAQIPDTQPHNTGTLTEYATGRLPDSYVANQEKIFNSITLRNSKGDKLDINDYPYTIVSSPFNTKSYATAVYSGLNIVADGININSTQYSSLLPDTVFSVVLLLNKKTISDSDSVWVHYNSYDFDTKKLNSLHKEIVNPLPLYRRNQEFETPSPIRYNVIQNTTSNQNYNLVVYGIASGYSGSL